MPTCLCGLWAGARSLRYLWLDLHEPSRNAARDYEFWEWRVDDWRSLVQREPAFDNR